MNLGAHMSIAGGVYKALERGESAGCNVVQIFTRNQTRWVSPPLKAEDVEKFRQRSPRFFSIFAHSSYLINLATPDKGLFKKSVGALAEELARCRTLGIEMLVLHPGAHKDQGETAGIQGIAEGLRLAYEQSAAGEVRVLLETTAGQGTHIGYRFEHLRDILSAADRLNLGVCFDTCHVFAAGYELRAPESYRQTWRQFDRCLGRQALRAIHLNDSKKGFNSHKDRHAHIGQGEIGLAGFQLLMADAGLSRIPMSLETPKGDDLREDVENLKILRKLRKETPAQP